MKPGNILSYVGYFFLFFILQIIFFRNVILFEHALCFIYIGYVLMLPIDIKPIPLILIAFGFGLLMDSFFDTIGINAFVCVFVAYVRPYILKTLTPGGGYDAMTEISISYMGFVWFVKYAALTIFIHHFIFFTLEAWDLSLFFTIMLRSFLSTLFTLFVLVLLQYLIKRTDNY